MGGNIGINIRPDFVIYAKNKTFAVDIFYPDSIRSLKRSVNIKERVYKNMDSQIDIYFVYANSEIDISDVDLFISRKKNQLAKNIKIISIDDFLNTIKKIEPLSEPLNYKPFYKDIK
ncbi:MAG: hypothetical protein A3A80_04400 [Candidatus Terrybacteria bacterium RIFCSPLOWO2_01_FULL_44_24]|uniref:Uncharacterized protein n=1 Tax=Candidatus Terrybacteria bacterium RIFCSPHIGHO2_01_FULL_43_35 TaxID=1802361 RepID=A0A1G2PC15_9BACT|nr:MAG: hypothetical protein A2828_01275 [Candidatus Terrybacteria bacterium RIFCSPHIGHO2_01_FULL_43_35]OHA49661.1 MAG: hypothetical protein A3B75_01055 [Candidatus Terrybacteria bacterium RIFCSPHIGHO2_02_FULL_43_14]OHA51326.1 MAG: hypothetical protein A3A80_04400 [Candidatus Terrybacteria bacterium RIFCSPLOWO2_01_FULL_44_24]